MRTVGYLLIVLLTLLCVSLFQRSNWRARKLIAGESLARQRIERIHCLAKEALGTGQQPRLATILADPQLAALTLRKDLAEPDLEFAQDDIYVYGLGLLITPGANNAEASRRFVVRAWPREFGVTGDLQFHIDSQGSCYHGQNTKGRSGVTVDFPPPFPAPDLHSRRAGWWPSTLTSSAQR